MRRIAVITTSRADFGIYLPLLHLLHEDRDVELVLLAGGMHLDARFGRTIDEVREHPFHVQIVGPTLVAGDRPVDIAVSMGRTTEAFAAAFESLQPDICVVLGDRFEMHAAACAAVPFTLPIAHIHGGETTEGAFDEVLRHALTKISHLHFPATRDFARRVIQMGEEPWRVTASGSPAIDALLSDEPLSAAEINAKLGIDLPDRFLLVTFHPVTREAGKTPQMIAALLDALRRHAIGVIATCANADTYGTTINHAMRAFADEHSWFQVIDNLGSAYYPSVLRLAAAVVGNSSSGIIEAGVFGTPVVNIGSRQTGRPSGVNVIDVPPETDAIYDGIAHALTDDFLAQARHATSPYGEGNAAVIIADVLKSVPLDDRLLRKRFHECAEAGDGPGLDPQSVEE